MTHSYAPPALGWRSLYCLLGLLLAIAARAQAPAWSGALGAGNQPGGSSITYGVATDGSGNVFVTGYFMGQVAFGNTVLTSAGSADLFVAKYVPGTNTWAWAQSGGGRYSDTGYGIAVSGTSVYVTGRLVNSLDNGSNVLFGGTGPASGTRQVNGASAALGEDLVLAKYTDQGSSATLSWTQVGGGLGPDGGYGVAASGTSVYVTGSIYNNRANSQSVVFGGGGTVAGTVPQYGAINSTGADLVLAKYTDQGSSATLGWTQVGGGAGNAEAGYGVAVSGSSVYVAGTIINNLTNGQGVVFGGGGTVAGTSVQAGASSQVSQDLVLAKYTDQGTSALLGWTQVGGGTSTDQARAVAVSGSRVYLTGYVSNNTANARAVVFGGGGTVAGTAPVNGASATLGADLVLAKYTDQGSSAMLGWTQVGGGDDVDTGQGVAVSGSSVYVTGGIYNDLRNSYGVVFGGSGTTAGTSPVSGASTNASPDLVLAKYTDQGSTGSYNWSQVGGGTTFDLGYGVALSGQQVHVVGYVSSQEATFSPLLVPNPAYSELAVLARLTDAALPLATHPVLAAGLALHPNPAPGGAATLTGATPGTAVQVLDALGRRAATATTDATGTAALGGLAPGLYLVRAGAVAARLAVE